MRDHANKIDGYDFCGEQARLIPVVADSNREQKAVSAALAAIHAVDEFGKELLRTVGAPARKSSKIDCYTEITSTGKKPLPKNARPDGLIVIRTGKRRWAAIVEAKVRGDHLTEQQITEYIDLARAHDVQAVITISNEFAPRPTHHPVAVSKRKLGKLELFHWSWTYMMTEAILQIRNHGIADPDQAYILAELVRFLSHDNSGISGMDALPKAWTEVCNAVRRDMRLSRSSSEVHDVVNAWQELTRYIALEFSVEIGRTVTVALPNKHQKDSQKREADDVAKLCDEHLLEERFELPDAASKVILTLNLKTRTATTWMELKAPKDRKQPRSCVTWIVNQLKKVDNADKIQLYARFPGRVENQIAKLPDVREDKECLLEGAPGKMPSAFAVMHELDLGGDIIKRKKIVSQLIDLSINYYIEVGQHLRAWVPTPPQVKKRKVEPTQPEPSSALVPPSEMPVGSVWPSSL